MEASLSKTRLDIEKVRQDIRLENRRFLLAAVGTLVASLGAGGVIGGGAVNYVNAHPAKLVASPPQIIYLQAPPK